MGSLVGLNEYLDECYSLSVFDQAVQSKEPWQIHLHEHRIIKAEITENLKYDIKWFISGEGDILLPKVQIKLIYPEALSDRVANGLNTDQKVKGLGLEPILPPGKRYHVKNKTLFPLMKERTVVFFTLLEGEVIRGIITGFSRYEIAVNLKGGTPVTILRHSIYDLRDKKGRCYLKTFQDTHRDWEKSSLFKE
jgi:hypothetical protein